MDPPLHGSADHASGLATVAVSKKLAPLDGRVARDIWSGQLSVAQVSGAHRAAVITTSKKGLCGGRRSATPRKRPKILPLNKATSEVASEQALLKALRAVLWDKFRAPQQKEAVRLAAARETPLVAILPTGGGKSLVFMMPAMLSGSGVTIVVAPYAATGHPLHRCWAKILDCKHWPRVALVLAKAASSDELLQG
ncbi:hypothetical protein V490_00322 [Pseudogymnoascus sp. VKM F-3557]|nr:hypothetical protein V490_00322 [Pseudogymnoascus sp. VKM F-3557]